jgi:hypothetical protein
MYFGQAYNKFNFLLKLICRFKFAAAIFYCSVLLTMNETVGFEKFYCLRKLVHLMYAIQNFFSSRIKKFPVNPTPKLLYIFALKFPSYLSKEK